MALWWWHLYGVSIPDKWDMTLLAGRTREPPEKAREWSPESGIDGTELPYIASWDHRPTIAEQNAAKIMHGLSPEVQADNVDDYGDDLDADEDMDDYGDASW